MTKNHNTNIVKYKTMKKFFLLAVSLLTIFSANADYVVQVKVSETSATNSFSIKKQIRAKAQKAAIKKYVLKLNANTPDKLIDEICNEYLQFIEDVENISEKWEPLDKHSGQLIGEYTVSLRIDKINKWLKEKGFSHSSGIRIAIMEEPPSLGQMKIDKAFGNNLDGRKFFIQNYTVFQRRLRDAIIKKVDGFGFDVKLLEDDDLYTKFKNKDANLVGVFFDAGSNEFVIDRDLLEAIKGNDPNTIILYYRIDALIYDQSTDKIRATIGFSLKNLSSSTTKVFGTPQTFEMPVKSKNAESIIDDMAFCVQCAMNLLMNGEDAGAQLNSIAMSIKNAQDMPQETLRLIVNATAFDAKIRKRALYTLKKELIAKKITSASQIKSSNTTLTAIIDNPNIKEADTLYMEHVSPILEKIGIELADDKVNYSGNTVTINP